LFPSSTLYYLAYELPIAVFQKAMLLLALMLGLTFSPLVSASCSVSNPNPAEANDVENYK
jgi:hypothetical protein